MRRFPFLVSILVWLTAGVAAQDASTTLAGGGDNPGAGFSFDELSRVPEGRALLAATTADYPVTPGDAYTLAFLKAADLATALVMVQSDYQVNLGVFGQVSARGLRFSEFKAVVEKRVAAAYPGSAPELIIRSTGSFTVKVEGEVAEARLIQSWGLERLSAVFARAKTSYSSERRVVVRGENGLERSYDLFAARRLGELAQDPYLHAGDTIMLGRAERRVTLAGSVYRPGLYQLLPGEGLPELLRRYGEGLLETALPGQSNLRKRASTEVPEGVVSFFDASRPGEVGINLADLDTVTIPDRAAYLPVVYFEGAIAMDAEAANQYATDRYPFNPGDMLSRALRAVAARLAPNADLRRAFIARKGKADTIPVDLEKLLYSFDPSLDIALEAEDRIVIPAGSLDVFVTGEVSKSSWVNSTALSRLSTVVGGLLTKYSSVRDIAVLSLGGEERRYDLYRAERYGELEQNPFLKPGDIVVVQLAETIVTVSGEVRRPGTYQLLEGEGGKELIESYCLGYGERANTERLTLVQAPLPSRPLGRTTYTTADKLLSHSFVSFDGIIVPAISELLPVAWFEGAIGVSISGEDPQAAQRIPYTFVPGDTLSRAVQSQRKLFTAVSDLEKASMVRGGTISPVDISKFLYEKDFSDDPLLGAGDTIIIPFRQFFVSVSGAVFLPGRYPYVPDRKWDYYVGLAGGIDEDRNSGARLDIVDVKGAKKAKGMVLEPEDTIIVKNNSFLYVFGKVSAILTTTISVVSLVLALLKF